MKILALLLIVPTLLLAAPFVTVDSAVESRVSGSDIIADRDGDGLDSLVNTAPTITLTGSGTVTYTEGDTYSELGATCTDTQDGSITVPAPSFSPSLNTASPGSYTATYTCTDSGGLTDTATRTVNVNSAGGGSVLAFTETTTTVMPDLGGQAPVVAPFEGDWGYINNDSCLDLVVMSHATDDPDGIYVQDVSGGSCQGTFTYQANTYRADNGSNIRFTSALMILDADNDGDSDFFGHDADGANGSLAAISDGDGTYTPTKGCQSDVDRCVPIDYDNDGDLEFVDSPLMGTSFNADVTTGSSITGRVYNWQDNTAEFTPNWAALSEPNLTRAWDTPLIFDANGDSYPDMVYAQLDLIFFGSASGFTSGTEGNFTAPAALFDTTYTPGRDDLQHSNHHARTFFDYDNDGDMDIIKMRVQKGGNNAIDIGDADADGDGLFLLQNNGSGVFTDVSTTELAGLSLTSLTYQTTYAGIGAGDFDNDGLTDLRIDWTDGSFANTCVILKNGGTGNWSKHSFPCSYVLDTSDGRVAAAGGASKTVFAHGDYDNDGKLDLVGSNAQRNSNKDTVSVHRNTSTGTGNWLSMFVRGGTNKDGFHSRITVKVPNTSTVICTREVYVAAQFGTVNPHCGLGSNTTVDIDLQFPHGGALVQFEDVTVNRTVALYATGQIQTVTRGGTLPPDAVASAVNTTLTLVADAGVTPTATELVTFGVPFAQGDVASLDEIKVSIGGTEQAVAIEQGLTWWADNSIRSATIQLQNLDMTGGNVTVTVDDTGSSVARLTKQPTLNGWANIIGATKDNHLSPRILPQHDPQYLADSGLIPPYKPDPVTPDAYQIYRDDMFDDWGGTPFDYSSSTGAHWLFDRATSHFKGYMASGETKYLAEAARAKQFYFSHVRNDGTPPAQSGGDGCFTYGGTACADGKYIYPQPAKLALALLGDDSQWDDGLINDMSEQAQLGWNQYWYAFPYDAENDGYTERSHGITMLAIANAYEITGDAGVLADLIQAVDYSRDMQQTTFAWETANGWPDVGCFRHAWSVHEGGPGGYGGDGVADDRRCSPWMSENIADALWQAYWGVDTPSFTNRSDIPEILRRLGEAIESYAYDDSTLAPSGPNVGTLTSCGNACTNMRHCTAGNTPLVFYSMSDIASSAALEATQQSQARPDTHMPEMVLIHAAARYFESNSTINAAHDARIASVNPDYYTQACADWFPSQGVPRVYNWQLRGNAQRTWDWVEEQ